MKWIFLLAFLVSNKSYSNEIIIIDNDISTGVCLSQQLSASPSNDKSILALTDVVNAPEPEISEEDLKLAKNALKKFLGKTSGEEAVNKLMKKSDKNANGTVNKAELVIFLEHIDLGNLISRDAWANGIMEGFGNKKSGSNALVLDREDAVVMLQYLELY